MTGNRDETPRRDAGTPESGSGTGRTDVTGHTNVYRATGPYPPAGDKVDIKTPGEFVDDGPRETGQEPTGGSEIIPPGRPAPGEKPR
jgi:hypothetical protein